MSQPNLDELKELMERDELKAREKRKLFDPSKILSSGIRKVYDEVLGEVRFGYITMREMSELQKIENDYDRSVMIITKMLQKAYPDFTPEKFQELPAHIGIRLLNLLVREAGFQTT